MAKVTAAPKRDSMKEFEVQNDMRTLQEAEEILKDPKRMTQVKAMAKKKAESLQKIASGKGLRAIT